VCGGTATTPLTSFDPSEGYSYVHFARTDGQTHTRFALDRVSVCLDCGHAALAFGAKRLAQIRSMLPVLAPVPEG
jgi:hypothetical protein